LTSDHPTPLPPGAPHAQAEAPQLVAPLLAADAAIVPFIGPTSRSGTTQGLSLLHVLFEYGKNLVSFTKVNRSIDPSMIPPYPERLTNSTHELTRERSRPETAIGRAIARADNTQSRARFLCRAPLRHQRALPARRAVR
jgi:hypothetical protein